MAIKQIALLGIGTTVISGGIVASSYYLHKNRTIRHKLISDKVTLISNKSEYEVAFMEHRGKNELIQAITTTEKVINSNTDAVNGGEALETWCNKQLDLELSDKNEKDVLPKVRSYCSKPSSTIEERFKKAGKKLITDNWNTKLESLKSTQDSNLQKDIGVDNLNDNTDKKVEQALQKWCETNIKKPLVEDKEDAIWAKVDRRCLETVTQKND